jgi:hypothetical protein
MTHPPFLIIDYDQPARLHKKRSDLGGVRLSRFSLAAAACVFLGLQCAASHAHDLQTRAHATDEANPSLIFDSRVGRSGFTTGRWDIDATDESDTQVLLPSGVPGFPPGTRLEHHQAQSAVTAEELNWGAENFGLLEIPKFDSLGGTRQLLQVRFSYLIRYNIIAQWQASTYDAHTYAHAWLEVGHEFPPFTTEFLGIPPEEGIRYGIGSLRPPFHPALTFPTYAQSAVGYQYNDDDEMWVPDFNHAAVVDDLDDAAALIGKGVAQFPTRWFSYEPDISDWVPPGAPPFPPDTVYAPELLSVEFVDALDELVVYYVYAVGDPIFDDGFEEPSLR